MRLTDIIKAVDPAPWKQKSFAKWYDDKDAIQRNYSRYVGTFDPTLTDALVRLYEATKACDFDNEEAEPIVEEATMEGIWDAYDAITDILRERGLE